MRYPAKQISVDGYTIAQLEALLLRVVPSGTNCMELPKYQTSPNTTPGRAGTTLRYKESVSVSRLMYALVFGPIAPGFEVDHMCENTLCIHPLHLQVVTHAQNAGFRGYPSRRKSAAALRYMPHAGKSINPRTDPIPRKEYDPSNWVPAPGGKIWLSLKEDNR